MGIKFGAAKGQAKKSNIEQYTYKNGDNVVRMTGDLLHDMFTGLQAKTTKTCL